jgi:hypothetical protein
MGRRPDNDAEGRLRFRFGQSLGHRQASWVQYSYKSAADDSTPPPSEQLSIEMRVRFRVVGREPATPSKPRPVPRARIAPTQADAYPRTRPQVSLRAARGAIRVDNLDGSGRQS